MAEKPKKKPPVDIDPAAFWRDVLERVESTGGGSNFIFPKAGRTRVRLVADPEERYFTEVKTNYRGRQKTKFLILAYDLGEEDPELRGMIIPRTVFRAIVGLITEGYELWDPDEGRGIVIVRTGSGRETSYSVMPSPKPVALLPRFSKVEVTLDEMAQAYEQFNARTNDERNRPSGDDEVDDTDPADLFDDSF